MIGAKLCPENSKNISDYGNEDSITLATHEAYFVPTAPSGTMFKTSWLIRWLDIVTEFGVSYKYLTGDVGREKHA